MKTSNGHLSLAKSLALGLLCALIGSAIAVSVGMFLFGPTPKTIPVPTASTTTEPSKQAFTVPPQIVDRAKPEAPEIQIKGTWRGQVRLWRRPDATCYLSVSVAGWESIFFDVSGSICEGTTP